MALRSRSRTANATSGPGRAPGSDGRLAHRRASGSRSHSRLRSHARHGRRHAPPEELRRRAEALFAGRAEDGEHAAHPAHAAHAAHDGSREETGKGPPPPGIDAAAGTGTGTGTSTAAPCSEGAGTTWRQRAGQALRERMPLWLQARCGLERRSVAALSVLLVVAAVFAVQHFRAGRTQPVAAPEVVREAAAYGAGDAAPKTGEGGVGEGATTGPSRSGSAPSSTTGAEIVVDVGGKVREPGIHTLPAGSRVADALRAAGGVRPGTKTDGLNQARFLVDGEQVIVGASAPAPPPPGAQPAPGGQAGAGPTAPVSLNTATTEQLDTLPGVGPVLAQHIIDYRTQHGGFRSVDELREVNGIGERRFADLRDLVRP
ncbi:ComEA family DNA-binding protein [Streptomyces sp. NPDC051135]|uniref:ComEA family DNA-binding protein n=1 Tax=unclassified Streptomyces TaxID=2593676 RepID=UPI003431AEE6